MIVIKSLKQTCKACPSQWEGKTADGRFIYIRYRYGFLTVHVGDTPQESYISDRVFGSSLGDRLDGILSLNELKRATLSVLQWEEDQHAA